MTAKRTAHLTFTLAVILLLPACNTLEPGMYEGFGNYQRPIQTESESAQAFFNQGMQLLYGFNHDEAIRSFEKAAEKDPASPMPYWGIAYANGININDPAMTEQRSTNARAAADEAIKRIGNATAVEAALVRAVDARYAKIIPDDRKHLDRAYAAMMGVAYKQFPDDPDVGALYAESLMNLQPWDYWDVDGKPKGRIEEIVAVLESTIEKHPNHPGANHFYIHAVEASNDPDRAVAAAERLEDLVPGSGHLTHMPSHIYIRVGRYDDAATSNRFAIKADRNYFKTAPAPKMYAVYYAHNLHFLAFAGMMSGQYEAAMQAARDLEAEMPEDALKAYAGLIEGIMPSTLHVMIRFGKWEEILQEPQYPEYRLVSRAVWHYARSIAHSALGNTDDARKELVAFKKASAQIPDEWYIFNNKVSTVMPIANAMIEGELLYREGKTDEAFAILRKGIEAEDALVYDEPPGWMLPVRHALGALLMGYGRAAEAEQVYREDLQRNRSNGWALIGLRAALNAQGKTKEAMALNPRIEAAWAHADVKPTSSCYCEPGKVSKR
jgi:tetratricopeptide (TPR) repeat protein